MLFFWSWSGINQRQFETDKISQQEGLSGDFFPHIFGGFVSSFKNLQKITCLTNWLSKVLHRPSPSVSPTFLLLTHFTAAQLSSLLRAHLRDFACPIPRFRTFFSRYPCGFLNSSLLLVKRS